MRRYLLSIGAAQIKVRTARTASALATGYNKPQGAYPKFLETEPIGEGWQPPILAQIGFARSNPHGAPQSNAFGRRVHEVYERPWLGE